jgi:hypothetical protein
MQTWPERFVGGRFAEPTAANKKPVTFAKDFKNDLLPCARSGQFVGW